VSAVLRADELAARVRDLPALPVVVTEVIRVTRDPDSSVYELTEVLARDQALTARVLRLANSALFGFPRRIATLSDAVVLLGFHTIKSLAIAGSAFGVMDRAVEGYGLERGWLWRHGIAAGAAARFLAQKCRPALAEEAFIAGLLHDLGKIVLDSYVRASFEEILTRVRQEGRPFHAAEREVLGFDHAEVGALVGEAWSLPPDLVEAIRYHHTPSECHTEGRLVGLAHLGNIVALVTGFGIGADGLATPLDGDTLAAWGFEMKHIEEAVAQMPDALADADALLNPG
jgi:HD-like signal output (HDOD) protein